MATDKQILQAARDILVNINSSDWIISNYLSSIGGKDVLGHLGARKNKVNPDSVKLAAIFFKHNRKICDINDGVDLDYQYGNTTDNFLSNSKDFGSWTLPSQGSVQINVIANPIEKPNNADGDKLTEGSGSGTFFLRNSIVGSSNNQIIKLTFYAKAVSRDYLAVYITTRAGNIYHTSFKIGDGTMGSVHSSVISTNIRSYNGWYRCEMVLSLESGATSPLVEIYLTNTDLNTTYTGNGTSGAYLWNARISVVENIPKNRVINALDDLIERLR
ncbi:MAG: hypothetical protein AABY22_30250 [Nanoarchaeota archaeon]